MTLGAMDGLSKIHFSSQRNGGRIGQHDGWIDPGEFIDFLEITPQQAFDCMLEAKRKDQALFQLRQALEECGLRECHGAS